jgi:hypothetical protein
VNNRRGRRSVGKINQSADKEGTATRTNQESNGSNDPENSVVCICQIAAQDKEHQSKEREFWRKQIGIARGLNWITGIGSAIALGAFVVLICSLYDARDATIVANRAWLFAHDMDFGNFKPGENIIMSVDIENIGHLPATLVLSSGYTDWGFIEARDESSYWISRLPPKDVCPPHLQNAGETIFPGQKFPQQSMIKDMASYTKQMQGVRDGTQIFYRRDCIIYQTFGEMHRTPFCFYLQKRPNGELKTGRCLTGNNPD